MSKNKDEKRLQETRQYWDRAAASFDDQPDHGLRDPVVRAAWTDLLKAHLPSTPSAVLDVGCGTGSLSILLAGLGHSVTGIDISPQMISLAKAKAAQTGIAIQFHGMDAADPHFQHQRFDVLICRHLLWALPEPKQVLRRWTGLLNPAGRLFFIEGCWHAGAGLHANQLVEMLPPSLTPVSLQDLSAQPDLWGGPVTDERYALIADRS